MPAFLNDVADVLLDAAKSRTARFEAVAAVLLALTTFFASFIFILTGWWAPAVVAAVTTIGLMGFAVAADRPSRKGSAPL
jgi:CHASE2 domain-containing sensor protein